jgi:DNA-binding CsgD family transcriptional regulator
MEDKENNPKRRQNQPVHHAAKSRVAVKQRRKKIIKAIAEGKTQQEAGIEAGLSPKTAQSQISQILIEPNTQKRLMELMDKVIPDEVIAAKYSELFNSKKVISAIVIASNGEGMEDANSMTRDFIEVPDYSVQLRANNSIAKLKGHFHEKRDLNIDFSNLTDEQLRDIAQGKLPKDI